MYIFSIYPKQLCLSVHFLNYEKYIQASLTVQMVNEFDMLCCPLCRWVGNNRGKKWERRVIPSFFTSCLNASSHEKQHHQSRISFRCVENSWVFAYLQKPVLEGHRLHYDVSITVWLEVQQRFKFQSCFGELNTDNRDFCMQNRFQEMPSAPDRHQAGASPPHSPNQYEPKATSSTEAGGNAAPIAGTDTFST